VTVTVYSCLCAPAVSVSPAVVNNTVLAVDSGPVFLTNPVVLFMQYRLDRCGHWVCLSPASVVARWVELRSGNVDRWSWSAHAQSLDMQAAMLALRIHRLLRCERCALAVYRNDPLIQATVDIYGCTWRRQPQLTPGHILWPMTHQWTDPWWPTWPMTYELRLLPVVCTP